MPTSADLEFYRRREAQERHLAVRAHNPEGRRVHLELARRYARMIEEAQQAVPHPTIRAVMPG